MVPAPTKAAGSASRCCWAGTQPFWVMDGGGTFPIPSMYGIFTYISLHLVDFYGKCREICHTWMLWVCPQVIFNSNDLQ